MSEQNQLIDYVLRKLADVDIKGRECLVMTQAVNWLSGQKSNADISAPPDESTQEK